MCHSLRFLMLAGCLVVPALCTLACSSSDAPPASPQTDASSGVDSPGYDGGTPDSSPFESGSGWDGGGWEGGGSDGGQKFCEPDGYAQFDVPEAGVASFGDAAAVGWSKTYPVSGTGGATINGLAASADGETVFGGTVSEATVQFGATQISAGEDRFGFLVRVSATGELAWTTSFQEGKTSIEDVAVDKEGRTLIVRRLDQEVSPGTWNTGELLERFDAAGAKLWSLPVRDSLARKRLVATSGGQIILVGWLSSAFDFGAGTVNPVYAGKNSYVASFDLAGKSLWTSVLPGDVLAAAEGPSSTVLVTGMVEAGAVGTPVKGTYVVTLDSSGQQTAMRELNPSGTTPLSWLRPRVLAVDATGRTAIALSYAGAPELLGSTLPCVYAERALLAVIEPAGAVTHTERIDALSLAFGPQGDLLLSGIGLRIDFGNAVLGNASQISVLASVDSDGHLVWGTSGDYYAEDFYYAQWAFGADGSIWVGGGSSATVAGLPTGSSGKDLFLMRLSP